MIFNTFFTLWNLLILLASFFSPISGSIIDSQNSNKFFEDSQLIFPLGMKEKLAVITEIIVTTHLNGGIITTLESNSVTLNHAILNLKRIMKKLRLFLLKPEVSCLYLPRIEDQKDGFDKLLAKYRQDLRNPWASIICNDFLKPDIRRALLSMCEIGYLRLHRRLLSQENVEKYMAHHLVDGSPPIFSILHAPKKYSPTCPMIYFAKYIQYEAENLLCETVFQQTNERVISFEEVRDNFDIDYKHGKFPTLKYQLYSKLLYARIPLMKFKKKVKLESTGNIY